MAEQQQRNVTFRGNVQGVGFRYTTCRIAGGYDVTGYVKNEPDGTVTVVAEGDRREVEAFLGDIEQRMGRHIRDKSEQSAPASGRFGSFGVKY